MTRKSIYVGAGDYKIITSSGKHNLLALLGTCTGVALYDRDAGLGGICHILLPDTPGHDYSWAPKVYATSCLTLMFNEMLQAGAAPAEMEAVVAGGSLPFPCSRQDINLDIGGRTRESVYQFLAYHGIPVTESKTGGCSGMTLTLAPPNWQATISLFEGLEEHTGIPPILPDKTRLRKEIIHLNPVPQIALKILRMFSEEDYQLSEIIRELRLDQVLSAKVISFCNTPYIGAPGRINSIERAALLLGETHLLEIILSTSMENFYNQKKGGYSLVRGGLYKHALATAHLAEIISRYNKNMDRHLAYTAGLLHDIGKVVLDQYVAENISLFYDQESCTTGGLIDKEQELFGTDHQETGHELARLWSLPAALEEAISLHHEPQQAHSNPDLVDTVYLANLLVSGVLAGTNLETPANCDSTGSLARLNLESPDLEEMISLMPWDKLSYL